jgi:hypothetical protein
MDDRVQHGDTQLLHSATSNHQSVEEDCIDSVAVLKPLAEPRVRTAMYMLTARLTSKAKECGRCPGKRCCNGQQQKAEYQILYNQCSNRNFLSINIQSSESQSFAYGSACIACAGTWHKESATKQGSLQAFFASNPAALADATSILQSCSASVSLQDLTNILDTSYTQCGGKE